LPVFFSASRGFFIFSKGIELSTKNDLCCHPALVDWSCYQKRCLGNTFGTSENQAKRDSSGNSANQVLALHGESGQGQTTTRSGRTAGHNSEEAPAERAGLQQPLGIVVGLVKGRSLGVGSMPTNLPSNRHFFSVFGGGCFFFSFFFFVRFVDFSFFRNR
jgi:hypothetical protein